MILEPVRFSWDISLGQLAEMAGALTPLIAIAYWLTRINRKLDSFLVEHEMLIADMTERKNIKPSDLPTRRKAGW